MTYCFRKNGAKTLKHNKKQKLYRDKRIRNYNNHYYETRREMLKSIKRKIQ